MSKARREAIAVIEAWEAGAGALGVWSCATEEAWGTIAMLNAERDEARAEFRRSAILHTPEGIPYSNDPDIMAALDLRHRIGFAEGAESVACMLSEGLMGERRDMGPEQEEGYAYATSDADDAAHGARNAVGKLGP